jgi:hypothetical protein
VKITIKQPAGFENPPWQTWITDIPDHPFADEQTSSAWQAQESINFSIGYPATTASNVDILPAPRFAAPSGKKRFALLRGLLGPNLGGAASKLLRLTAIEELFQRMRDPSNDAPEKAVFAYCG